MTQGWVCRIDVEPDDVHAGFAPRCREFDTGNDASSRDPGVDPIESCKRIVIRYGQRIDTTLRGVQEQIVRVHGTIGGIAVRMQIVDHVAGIIRTRRRSQSLAADV